MGRTAPYFTCECHGLEEGSHDVVYYEVGYHSTKHIEQ